MDRGTWWAIVHELKRVGHDSEREQSTNINIYIRLFTCFPVVKNPLANAGDAGDKGSIPGSGRGPGSGHGNPLQYACLGKSMKRGTWWVMVHQVTKSQA